MHKLVRKAALFAALAVLFGAALSARAQTAAPAAPSTGPSAAGAAFNGALSAAFPALGPISTVVGSGVGPLISGISPKIAEATAGIGGSFLGWIGLKGIGYVLYVLSYIIGLIGSTVFTLAGLFVEFGLYLNTTILDSSVVQLGWRFCRDLANLGFTIGIVVIAYATMLGYENYGMKKLIRNFIIAAVVVNFSFSMAGFLIDMSNMLTHFFVNASIGGGGVSGSAANIHKFAETLASAFSPQKLLVTDGNLRGFESLAEDGIMEAVLGIFFVALFTAFAALGMLAVGLTTIWRFAHLSGLVIVMPMAVLCYAFPKTQKHYNKWWEKFSCQLTYLPTATFFMYIIIMFVQIKANIGLGSPESIDLNDLISKFEEAKGAGGLTTTKTLSLMAKPFQTITDMILVLTMLFLAIIKARDVGCSAGKIAIDGVEGLRDWATGKGKYKFSEGRGAAGWAGSKILSGGMDAEGTNRGTRLANFMARVPIVSRFVPQVNNFAAGTKRRVGNFETEYKGLGDQQLINALYNPDIKINPERMAAAAKEAASRGLFSEDDRTKGVSQEKFAEFIPALKRFGMDEDVLKKMPYLYGKFGWNITKDAKGEYANKDDGKKFDGVMKGFKAEDMENLPIEAFADPEIVSRLKSTDLEKLPKKKEIRDAFAKTFNALAEPDSMGPEKFRQFVAKVFAKPEADAALLPALLANPLVVKGLTNANLKKLGGPDKKEHREAFIKTIGDPLKFSDKELAEFMRDNFANPKSIDEIHPDIISNKRFFNGLNEKHIERMNAEPEEKQQEAMIATLRESYRDLNEKVYEKNEIPKEETLAKLDRMAKVMVEKKKDWQWSTLANNDATREAFKEIEGEYRKRNPDDDQLKQRRGREAELKTNKKRDDDAAYGPSAPKPGPYPVGGGGPSAGGPRPPTPPAPPETPKGPYPSGGGGPSGAPKTNPPQSPPAGNAGGAATPPPAPQPPTNNAQNATPSMRPPVIDPDNSPSTDSYPRPAANPKPSPKEAEIKAAMDAVLNGKGKNNPDYVPQEEFPQPIPPATPIPPPKPTPQSPTPPPAAKTPATNPFNDEEYLASLEAATNPNTPKATETKPITPPELDVIAKQETDRLKAAEVPAQKQAQGKGWEPQPTIDAEWEPKPKPAAGRIAYEGPLTPPEQKPASVPEPVKTILDRERNANANQISVIPKFQPADQPKRITYQGSVTPPPIPTIPEPIRSFLREEKDRNDNQQRGTNNL